MWKELEKRFPKHWNKTAENILKAAFVLLEAKKTLPPPFYKEMRKSLELSDRIAQALVKIGKTKRLYDKDVKSRLPDSWGTLEALIKLPVNKLEQLISSGMLNRKLKRIDIEKMLYGTNNVVKQDWSHTNKVITVRIDKDCKDPNYINEIKKSLCLTVDNLKSEYEMTGIHIEDHELDVQVSEENTKRWLDDMNGAKQEGLQWGKKICMLMRKKGKANATKADKIANARGQRSFSWDMDETKFITDEEGLQAAFGELGIDWIDVDELMRDPEIGREAYEKLRKTH